jgi:hypothetical protein
MLFDKSKLDEGDIITFKMSSGEEILGKLKSQDMMTVTIAKPVVLAMTKNGPGMAPALMTVNPDADLMFNRSSIAIGPALTDKEIANQYTFQTTGIQPVTAGSIIS